MFEIPEFISSQYLPIFSNSAAEREVETVFLTRLRMVAQALNNHPGLLIELVNSGKFNEIFPSDIDENTPVSMPSFDSVSSVDFRKPNAGQ